MIAADRLRALIARSALCAAALLAACQPADRSANNSVTAAPVPVAPNAQSAPVAAASPAADLTRYVGHYPFDAVDGTAFLDDPAVTAAVRTLVPDAALQSQVLRGGDVGTPIVADGGALVAWGCEAHNCGNHNWTIQIAPDGTAASVCYHDAAAMGDRARWYLAPGQITTREGGCPSDRRTP
jgi:hypothetical protein